MTDPLARRLRTYFEEEGFRPRPELPARISEDLPASDSRRSVRWSRHRLVTLVAAVVAVLAVATSMPVAASTSPVSVVPRWVLAAAGLTSATELFMPVQGSATWDGVTIELVAAYADDVRTVVALQAGPLSKVDGLMIAGVTMYDASGHVMGSRGGMSLDGGHHVLRFEPIPTGDGLPTKLTLLIWALDPQPGSHNGSRWGLWTLQFEVSSQGGHVLPLPAPGQAGRMSARFTSVRAVPGALAISLVTRDDAPGERCRNPVVSTPAAAGGPTATICSVQDYVPLVRVYDPSGRELRAEDGGGSSDSAMFARHEMRWSGIWPVTGAGAYRVVISDAHGASFERTIEVP